MKIIASTSEWCLSGVNTFFGALLRALSERGFEPEILVTRSDLEVSFEFPQGIRHTALAPTHWKEIRRRQQLFIDYVTACAPCIVLPNYDFDMALTGPALPPDVHMFGILHSDEPCYYESLKEVQAYWTGVIAVSEHIAATATAQVPQLGKRLTRINYGIATSQEAAAPRNLASFGPLRVIYSGRLQNYQKRVFDLAKVIQTVHRQRLSVRFSILGDGDHRAELERSLADAQADGYVRILGQLPAEEARAQFREHDVIILTSEFEGLPLVLLEAMAEGCVPVVTRIPSGINELVREGVNGFTLPVGDIAGFVRCLGELAKSPERVAACAEAASTTLHEGPYAISSVADRYTAFFHERISAKSVSLGKRGKPKLPRNFRLGYRLLRKARKLCGIAPPPEDRPASGPGQRRR